MIQEINCFVRYKSVVFVGNELGPGFTWISTIYNKVLVSLLKYLLCNDEPSKNVVIMLVEFYVVLVEVSKQFICTKDTRDLDKLVVVIMAVEEWFFAEYLQIICLAPSLPLPLDFAAALTMLANMQP